MHLLTLPHRPIKSSNHRIHFQLPYTLGVTLNTLTFMMWWCCCFVKHWNSLTMMHQAIHTHLDIVFTFDASETRGSEQITQNISTYLSKSWYQLLLPQLSGGVNGLINPFFADVIMNCYCNEIFIVLKLKKIVTFSSVQSLVYYYSH